MMMSETQPQPTNELMPYEQRMLDEHSELTGRILRLEAFLNDPHAARISPMEALRMVDQLRFMCGYRQVLGERIKQFWPEFPL